MDYFYSNSAFFSAFQRPSARARARFRYGRTISAPETADANERRSPVRISSVFLGIFSPPGSIALFSLNLEPFWRPFFQALFNPIE